MNKLIKLSNNAEIKYNTKNYDGFEDILSFYEPKLKRLVYNWKGKIPFHDEDDMMQVCRMKLVDALENFDEKKNIQFSTYVYTAWHRKLAQMVYKSKSKKYSSSFDTSKNVSFNHAIDKDTKYQYLRLGRDKCPLKDELLTVNTCKDCPYFLKHKSKRITRGNEKGIKFKHTMCNYYIKVMDGRGLKEISLNKTFTTSDNSNTGTLIDITPCNKQQIGLEENTFGLDLGEVRMGKRECKILVNLMNGYNKIEIIKMMKITESKYDKTMKKIKGNEKLMTLLGRTGEKKNDDV